MRKVFRILPFLLLLFVMDRLMFLPGRMDNTWVYEEGTLAGDPITFNNIEIINNFEVKIQKSGKWNTFYLVGCYFGNLYLLDEENLKYTKYTKLGSPDDWF